MEPEYDVPAGQVIQSSQVLADAGGNPVIMAQLGMLFGSKEKPAPYMPDKMIRNVHSIAFAKQNGTWKPHAFRNVQSGSWIGSAIIKPSHLARGNDGNILAFVWDRNAIGVHALEDGAWVPRKKGHIPGDGYFETEFGRPYIGISRNGAWQAYSFAYSYSGGNSFPRQRILTSDGGFVLDSIYSFRPMAFLAEREFNLLVGLDVPPLRPASDRGIPGLSEGADSLPDLIYYRWSRDQDPPRPSRHVMARESKLTRGFTAVVEGENRFYGREVHGGLEEFAFRDGDFRFLRELSFPDGDETEPLEGDEGGNPLVWTYASMTVDSKGCLHGVMDLAVTAQGKKGFVHRNSCSPALDTAIYPEPAALTGMVNYAPRELVSGADGTVMFAFFLQELFPWEDVPYSPEVFRSSWLYLARYSQAGKWEIELAANY